LRTAVLSFLRGGGLLLYGKNNKKKATIQRRIAKVLYMQKDIAIGFKTFLFS
jgi:hypothetical protein